MLTIIKGSSEMADIVSEMQKKSFMPLLERYQDYDMSPAMESLERVREKIERANTDLYIFQQGDINVGCVRITRLDGGIMKISALCILPEYQNQGISQQAMSEIEGYYKDAKKWILATILQETGNCYLYEKLGYKKVNEEKVINENMTIVDYEKVVDKNIT